MWKFNKKGAQVMSPILRGRLHVKQATLSSITGDCNLKIRRLNPQCSYIRAHSMRSKTAHYPKKFHHHFLDGPRQMLQWNAYAALKLMTRLAASHVLGRLNSL